MFSSKNILAPCLYHVHSFLGTSKSVNCCGFELAERVGFELLSAV